MAQAETGAAGTVHFEPGGVIFWDNQLFASRRISSKIERAIALGQPLNAEAATVVEIGDGFLRA